MPVSTPASLSSIRSTIAALPFSVAYAQFSLCRLPQSPPGVATRAWSPTNAWDNTVDMSASPLSAFAGLYWVSTEDPGGGGGGGNGEGGGGGE